MLLTIPDVFTKDEAKSAREKLERTEWVDGKVTAGYQSAKAKNNMQIPESHPTARELGDKIVEALGRNPLFMSAAIPLRVFPPLFNLYQGGQSFGTHVDNAIRQVPGTPHRVRTDISATLFLTEPSEYDGGELVVEDTYGIHEVKLPAGQMIMYPATSLHHVKPVTRGARISSFFWIQSMIRDDAHRTLLFDLDTAIQRLAVETPQSLVAVQLNGVYQNLLRQWTEL